MHVRCKLTYTFFLLLPVPKYNWELTRVLTPTADSRQSAERLRFIDVVVVAAKIT